VPRRSPIEPKPKSRKTLTDSPHRTPPVGIDLGTTYTAVAYIDDTGRPITLVNAEGDLVTPSVVLFEGDQAIVGKEALKALAT
jgi:molecular chaperone DnaK